MVVLIMFAVILQGERKLERKGRVNE